MLLEKQPLSMEELEAQNAIELPQRDTLLVTVVITNVLNNLTIEIDVRNVNVAAQICAAILTQQTNVTCEVRQ